MAGVAVAAGPVASGNGTVGDPAHFTRMVLYASVALLFSFLCSVAEAVLLSVSPAFVAHQEHEGHPSAARLRRVKDDVDRSLAGILTLNTIAHTVGAGGAGAEAAAYFGERWIGVSMAVLTLLILFLSEIVPKTLGAVYWRPLATPTAWFVRGLILSLYPLIWASERLTRLITRNQEVEALSRGEFRALAQMGAEGGHLDETQSRIFRNMLRFRELTAEDIMTPRTVVFSLQQDRSVREVLEEQLEIPFSRIPLYGKNRDDVTGLVLKTDLLTRQLQGRGDDRLLDLKREIRFIPETMSLERVAEELLDQRAHILAVFEEHGGLAGVVSLEDVVETLLGIEIVDEADRVEDLRRLARERWHQRMEHLGVDLRHL